MTELLASILILLPVPLLAIWYKRRSKANARKAYARYYQVIYSRQGEGRKNYYVG